VDRYVEEKTGHPAVGRESHKTKLWGDRHPRSKALTGTDRGKGKGGRRYAGGRRPGPTELERKLDWPFGKKNNRLQQLPRKIVAEGGFGAARKGAVYQLAAEKKRSRLSRHPGLKGSRCTSLAAKKNRRDPTAAGEGREKRRDRHRSPHKGREIPSLGRPRPLSIKKKG